MYKIDKPLLGKTAIITGSTRGIGKALAKGMGDAGAKIVVVSRSQSDCDTVAGEFSAMGIEAIAQSGDLTKKESIDFLVAKTLDKFGTIDILVNNAGTSLTKKAEDISEEDWDKVIDLNLRSAFFTAQAIGKVMLKQGRGKIINICSVLSWVAEKQVLPYAVAKAGLMQMTRTLALEWAKKGVFVNALCPGYIITDINREQLSNEKIAAHLLGKTPLGRFGKAEEMVGAAIFMASDQSDYMTGQAMILDGGWTIQ